MVSLTSVVATLKREEQNLLEQLGRIQSAISSLEFGGVPAGHSTPRRILKRPPAAKPKRPRRKRGWSAAARKAASARMKGYWAAKRKQKK